MPNIECQIAGDADTTGERNDQKANGKSDKGGKGGKNKGGNTHVQEEQDDQPKETTPRGKKQKTQVDQALIDMQKLRARVLNFTGKARSMITSITSGQESWEWAANDQNLGKLQEFLGQVDADIASRGVEQLMHCESKVLKSKRETAEIINMCHQFSGLQPSVAQLESQYNKMLKHHHAETS